MRSAHTRRSLGGAAHWVAIAWLAVALLLACSTTNKQAGGLELIIRSDGLNAPGDFDDVRLEVSQQVDGGWNGLWNKDYLVPQETMLPATFAIAAGRSPDQETLVRVIALKGSTPVVLREAQVQVPTDRVAELLLVLAQACKGQVMTVGAEGEVVSTCPVVGESCQPDTGACGSSVIAEPLPTYDAGDLAANRVDGGAAEAGSTDVTADETVSVDAPVEGEAGSPDVTCPSGTHCDGDASTNRRTTATAAGAGTRAWGERRARVVFANVPPAFRWSAVANARTR
jgi:hypothetical protein